MVHTTPSSLVTEAWAACAFNSRAILRMRLWPVTFRMAMSLGDDNVCPLEQVDSSTMGTELYLLLVRLGGMPKQVPFRQRKGPKEKGTVR